MKLSLLQEKQRLVTTIAIASGKGGVGKSTLCAALASSLRKLDQKVGILDADLYGPSMAKMLAITAGPKQENGTYIPAVASGIKIMSMAFFKKEGQDASLRAPMCNNILSLFINEVSWGPLDFLLIDLPPGTGDIQLTVAQKMNISCALFVTTPQEIALMDVRRAISLFEHLKIPIFGVIENMSYFLDSAHQKHYIFGKDGGKRLASEKNIPFLGEIPLQEELCKASDEGRLSHWDSDLFLSIAKGLLQWNTKDDIERFYQKDPHTFSIQWKDGRTDDILLRRLQQECPCAGCLKGKKVENDVMVKKIERVGHVAFRFQFTSGCSFGIYDLELLQRIKS